MPASAASAADLEHVMTRWFDAPARLIFEAYSKPEHLLHWFGPKPYPLALCEVDFRVGGRYRFAMKNPDGELMTPFAGKYLEIVPDKRIKYDNTFEQPGAETMVVTVDLDEQGDRTRLTLHTRFASAAQKALHLAMGYEKGVGVGYDQLADVVAGMKR